MNAESFFSRWQQRPTKVDEEVAAHDAEVRAPAAGPAPLPTESDLTALAPGASVDDFMRVGVDEGVKRGALKKLFADPHYNVMDGLDTYIADYGVPDPIPEAMLRGLNQVKSLFLFEHAADRPGFEDAGPQAVAAEGQGVAESGAALGQEAIAAHEDASSLPVDEPQTFSLDAESPHVEISPPSRPHCCARDGLALSGEPQCGSKPRFAPSKGEGAKPRGMQCALVVVTPLPPRAAPAPAASSRPRAAQLPARPGNACVRCDTRTRRDNA